MSTELALSAIEKAKQRLFAIKAQQAATKKMAEQQILAAKSIVVPKLSSLGWRIDNSKPWNAEQLEGINLGLSRKSFCLIGAAGTGKTSTLKGIVYSLLGNNLIAPIADGSSTKHLAAGSPGICLVSFTNMAVRQIAKQFGGDISCLTIHKLLEFAPEYISVVTETGETITKMQFAPSRNRGNPLPRSLTTIVVDESSMVDCDLYELLIAALPDPASVQFIFLGDLNQLPPVYGGPILGKKLLELPIVELTRVYRQALESPIIRYAIEMKNGNLIPISLDKIPTINGAKKIVEDNGEHGKVTIHPWSKSISSEDALNKATGFCKAAIRDGELDPMQDIILCPFNVKFGVVELNLAIADYLGKKRNATVVEVIAGFNTHYYAVGDKVLVQKREALITGIKRNPRYVGKKPIDCERFKIDRYGGAALITDNPIGASAANFDFDSADFDVDLFLDNMQMTTVVDRVTSSSHEVTVEFIGSENDAGVLETAKLTSASEVNDIIFAYAITVHKSQGSEWRKVFFLLHNSHHSMCSRELMYTGMTRAKSELYMIVEPDRVMKQGTLSRAAKKPRLVGNTLAEKLVSLKARFAKETTEKQDKQGKLTLEESEAVE